MHQNVSCSLISLYLWLSVGSADVSGCLDEVLIRLSNSVNFVIENHDHKNILLTFTIIKIKGTINQKP